MLKRLMAQREVVQYDPERGSLIHADYLGKAKEEILSTLAAYHRNFPLKAGLSKEELRSRTVGSRNQKLFIYLINQLVREGGIIQEKELIHLADHKVTLAQDQEDMRQKIQAVYLKGGLQPPYFKELKKEFPAGEGADVLQVMVKEGTLVKVKEDLFFHKEAIEGLRERLIAFFKDNGEITTPQFKDMTGVSRKYAIPLIEYFDRTQVTVRVGDNRILRKT